ncbi:hypothetical protein VNO77_21763 [Canavalia gladiata]|uniref:Uncharacterized protein n=1 Tax=Canavalia gladiata TaxID=3824 RepID=A0AAN9L286_CANGL
MLMTDRSLLQPGIIKVSTYTHRLTKPRGHNQSIGYKDWHRNYNRSWPRDPQLSQVQSYASITTLITGVVFASENWMNASRYLGLIYIRLTKDFATLLPYYTNLGIPTYFSNPNLEPIVPTAQTWWRTRHGTRLVHEPQHPRPMTDHLRSLVTWAPLLLPSSHHLLFPKRTLSVSSELGVILSLIFSLHMPQVFTILNQHQIESLPGVHGTVADFGIGSLAVYETISPYLRGYRSGIKANQLNGGLNQLLDGQIELSS